MDVIHQDFRVRFHYPVHFTRGLFSDGNRVLRDLVAPANGTAAEVIVVIDDGVARAHARMAGDAEAYARRHGDAMRLAAPVLVVTGGEPSKNDPRHLEAIRTHIHGAGLCRHSYVIAVGGGALLDVAGYAASTAHRGVRLIRVPTTVLAQADSAVGVKNGVNGFGLKNYFGVFAPPYAVINDFDVLTTLEDRDWRGGITEAIKVGLVRDASFFEAIEQDAPALAGRDLRAMERVIRRSVTLHLEHIAGGDPFETGSSRPLDFGHWAAHKIESLSEGRIRHGEAVAVGMALDCTYAWLTGMLSERDWRRVLDLLRTLGLDVHRPELDSHVASPDHPRSIFRGLAEFREHLGGELTVMMLAGIGRPVDVHAIDTAIMARAIAVLRDETPAGTPRAHALTTSGSR